MKIELETSPTPADEAIVQAGLREFNEAHVSGKDDRAFAVFLREADGAVMGGVLARAGRGWLHVRQLWVHEDLRGRGYGRQLMDMAEDEGRRLGCHGAYLTTFSFQARPFYEGCGYEVFGVLDAFPDEHRRFFMRKML